MGSIQLNLRLIHFSGGSTIWNDASTWLLAQQERRDHWVEDHGDLLRRHRVLIAAERAIEMRIRQHPLAQLPNVMVGALGREPALQRERATWIEAAAAVAIHHHRHGVEVSELGDGVGPAAVLGERPVPVSAALSWDYAAAKLADAGIDPAH